MWFRALRYKKVLALIPDLYHMQDWNMQINLKHNFCEKADNYTLHEKLLISYLDPLSVISTQFNIVNIRTWNPSFVKKNIDSSYNMYTV